MVSPGPTHDQARNPVRDPARARGRAAGRLVLASRSPRRRAMLDEAGIVYHPSSVVLDDGGLRPGAVSPAHWVASLAYLKAAYATASAGPGDAVLGADTLCATESGLLGQPADAAEARAMIRSLRNGSHAVLTGVALVGSDGRRDLFVDQARVRVGAISDSDIDSYLASGAWAGKAGGYNLAERQAAGWPLDVRGDPTTVMGLPMRLLPGRLEAWFNPARVPA